MFKLKMLESIMSVVDIIETYLAFLYRAEPFLMATKPLTPSALRALATATTHLEMCL